MRAVVTEVSVVTTVVVSEADDADAVVVCDDDAVVVSDGSTVVSENEVIGSSDVSDVDIVVASSVLRSVAVVTSGTDIDIGGFVSASITEISFSGAVVTAEGRVSSQSPPSLPPQPVSISAAASRMLTSALILYLFIKTTVLPDFDRLM